MSQYAGLMPVFKREFRAYFATPLGYIFIVIFLVSSGTLTLARDFGRFLELRHAGLEAFFAYLPLIFVVLVPAVAMRLWSEERKTGTVELLFTLPITLRGSYLGKFLAGWAFLLVNLVCTWPIVATVFYLGSPDFGAIVTGYLGAGLMVGTYLSIGMFFSALTKNQVVAFILGVTASVVFLALGLPQTIDVLSQIPGVGGYLAQVFASLSLSDHFNTLTRGLVELRGLAFFTLSTLGWLTGGMILLDNVKAS